MELLTLCRSCMVEVASWELQNFDGIAVKMFTFCTNVEVSEDDKLPKQFCCDCKIKIDSSYTFIKKAQEVDVTLKNLLSSSEETNVIVKTENLVNDLQYSESNSLKHNSGFGVEVKMDGNEDKMYNPKSNQSFEYKMEFDIYQTSPENSENELDESLINKEFDLPDMKPNSKNIDDFNKHSDRLHNDDPHVVQKIISEKDSNCTNNKINRKKNSIKRQKESSELGISLRRKTNNTRTRIHTSNKFKTIEKGKEISNEEENFFQCDICKQRYKYKKVLRKHLETKHSKLYSTKKEKDEDRPKGQEEKGDDTHPVVKTCDICDRTFISSLWFSRHMNKHSDSRIRKYFCNYCSKSFHSNSTYRHHTDQHVESRRFACGECGARFKRGTQLAAHALAQPHALPHVCAKCGMAFKTKSILTSHMNSHVNEKPFLCGICGFRTKYKQRLTTHMQIHTGEKPYACNECAFRAISSCRLRQHMLRHRGERPHACQHCGRLFYEANSMAKHIQRVHTFGECPYQCYLCPQAFSTAWKCKTHIKKAHSIPFKEIKPISKYPAPKNETISQPA